jgi:hypothetical protein
MNRIRYIKLMDKCNYNRIETAAYLINKLRETLLEMKPLIQEHERQGGTVDSFFQEEIMKIDEEFLLRPYHSYRWSDDY